APLAAAAVDDDDVQRAHAGRDGVRRNGARAAGGEREGGGEEPEDDARPGGHAPRSGRTPGKRMAGFAFGALLAEIDPPVGPFAELGAGRLAELDARGADLDGMLRELVALLGEGLLLLGAEVEGRGPDVAQGGVALREAGALHGEGVELAVDLGNALLGGAEI